MQFYLEYLENTGDFEKMEMKNVPKMVCEQLLSRQGRGCCVSVVRVFVTEAFDFL